MDYIQSEHENNFYAEGRKVMIYILGHEVDVESIFYSKDEDKVYLHCGSKEFEGDIDIESLSEKNQAIMADVFSNADKPDPEWERVSRLVEAANEMLVPCAATIHVQKYDQGTDYFIYYIAPDGEVVNCDEGVILDDVFDRVEVLWSSLLHLFDWMKQTGGTAKAEVTLHRVTGDSHSGEAVDIYSWSNCTLFFVNVEDGSLSVVGDNIDDFAYMDGYFAVNPCDYTDAMREIALHEAGLDGN